MRRIIKTSLVVLAFSCVCYAGEIPNNVTIAGEIPNNAQVKGEIQNGVTNATEPQTGAIIVPEIGLSLLQNILTLF